MLLAGISIEWVAREIQRPLVLFGFAGQFIFFLRFAVQWFASERRGRSHIPIVFWYLSLVGGGMTFVYAVLKPDLVFMIAQALGLLIYARNLMLIYRRRWQVLKRRDGRGAPGPGRLRRATNASAPRIPVEVEAASPLDS